MGRVRCAFCIGVLTVFCIVTGNVPGTSLAPLKMVRCSLFIHFGQTSDCITFGTCIVVTYLVLWDVIVRAKSFMLRYATDFKMKALQL